MPVEWSDQQDLVKLEEEVWQKKLEGVLEYLKCDKTISFALVDDKTIQELHYQYLGENTPTDVLSFPLSDNEEDPLMGEVVVSVERALWEAKRRHHPFEAELFLYLVHGILHLLGYTDEEERERQKMVEKQNEILQTFGYPPISD